MEKNKGITLIALVITIIVLLILAGISIATLTGQNGILTKTNTSKTETIKGEETEQIKLAYNAVITEKLGNGDNSEVTAEQLQKELENLNAEAIASGSKPITIKFIKTENIYTVNNKGEIVSKDGNTSTEEMIHFTLNNRKFEVSKSEFEETEDGSYIGFINWLLYRSNIEGLELAYMGAGSTHRFVFRCTRGCSI